MSRQDRNENEEHFDEPSLEDFLPNEEDKIVKDRQMKHQSLIRKFIAAILVIVLFISLNQVWPRVINFSSIKFLQKSSELSKQDDIKEYKEAVVTIQDQYTKGTGFNISETGLIVTNKHVVDDMHPITVMFPNGEWMAAEIISAETDLDLAFLKIKGEKLPHISLSEPDEWLVQDHIYVIGNPLFHNQIVNEGNILQGSDKNGVLRLSAPIYKGNSGSPVISSESGKVIGVVYAKSMTEDVGYAIPIEQVLEKLPNK
ncbi:S1C family serine protease [Schinkia azotoformans]|uniref:S1C family serine protease n=1 Tax=Schinkia azotoformans TaxID=1454 RepID=UPI002DBFA68E|nr:serine protease [Schinkia azotoformans]MEC1772671.1 serine protease [Schinkia azotoformans]MED4368544.1 serine protease [Schinkia azotoformans]